MHSSMVSPAGTALAMLSLWYVPCPSNASLFQNEMLEEGHEYAVMLYTWRSCSRAIPQVLKPFLGRDVPRAPSWFCLQHGLVWTGDRRTKIAEKTKADQKEKPQSLQIVFFSPKSHPQISAAGSHFRNRSILLHLLYTLMCMRGPSLTPPAVCLSSVTLNTSQLPYIHSSPSPTPQSNCT